MMKENRLHILLVDNYDSFSYNLVEALRMYQDIQLDLLKNDDPSILAGGYDAVIISPGPGLPSESGLLMKALDKYIGSVPVFGVCLGLQAIVEHFGGSLRQLSSVFHGIQDCIEQDGQSPIFLRLPKQFKAGRYHSWVANEADIPMQLSVRAKDQEGNVMAVENENLCCYAVQFHPESYMTVHGAVMFENFVALVRNHKEQSISKLTK